MRDCFNKVGICVFCVPWFTLVMGAQSSWHCINRCCVCCTLLLATHTPIDVKGLTDKKFKLFNVNVNCKNIIYCVLSVFIILTYSK